VNCADCQTEPLTPGHYCPCCGRKLSLEERRAAEATSPATRCQSCGGVSADGDLCRSCRQAFAPVLDSATVTVPSDNSPTVTAQQAPTVIKATKVAPPPPIVNVEAIKIEAFKSETAKAVADMTAKAHLAKGANPAPVTRRPIASVPPQRRSRRPLLITATVVIVVAIGAAEGARRLGFHWSPGATREAQPVQAIPAVESVAAAERPATSDTRASAKVIAENRAPAAPPQAAARPKPRTAAERRGAVRQANLSDQHVTTVVPSARAPETSAPVPQRPPAAVAAESQGVPAPPTGRVFERNDVDESPQLVTRIEPQLPANLPVPSPNDVVVVRVLVSQTGHPFRISVLRGSRLGRSADEAVVAAVTRWTFSPARKRGEPVNCWYNVGVPLGQAPSNSSEAASTATRERSPRPTK
jgi:hypothetical protein